MTEQSLTLAPHPNWHAAARMLLSSFLSLDQIDDRVRVLDKLCAKLDCGLYPAFLQILFIIEGTASDECKALVAETFMHAISTGRMPEGKVPAWGAGESIGGSAYGHTRRLGPIEFTCAWYAQPGSLPKLVDSEFTTVAMSFIRLFSTNSSTRKLYCQKLIADSRDTISGTLSANTRHAIHELASQWADDKAPDTIVRHFKYLTCDTSTLNTLSRNPFQ